MPRKRRYRRTRYRSRPRMKMRRRWRRSSKYKCAPEVKIMGFIAECQSQKLAIASQSSASLYSAQNFLSNALSFIEQGTDYTQRVGGAINLKGMRLRLHTFACSSSEIISIGDYWLRIIIWAGQNSVNTNITDFFALGSKVNFHLPINRKKVYNVLYDRVHHIHSGGFVNDASSANATVGSSKPINIWLPLNRRVVYSATTGNPKDFKNYINVAMLVGTPGMCNTSYDNRQISCTYYAGQIFFTDC